MRRILVPVCLMLSACMPAAPTETATRAAQFGESTMPPMKTFAVPRPSLPQQSNSDIARDFLDLTFMLESGRRLPYFSRFEGPVSVHVTGTPPANLRLDLNRLLSRLRNEAGLDIHLTNAAEANITIEAVSRAEIRRNLPQAACFVVPNISKLSEYRKARRTGRTDWAQVKERKRLAIFLPSDAAPQEVRDCLHEELAQALGPLNDLYRLPDSVFNDDNVHTVLTGFDMMILRLYYAPELRAGMTRSEVAARLPALLARINPAGQNLSPRHDGNTPRSWVLAIQTALGPGTGPAERRRAAEQALQIARTMGWKDHRMAFSHYAMGRLTQRLDDGVAQEHFIAADHYYSLTPNTALHRAYVASQLAAYALAQGRGEDALTLASRHLGTAERYENAALLSTLMLLRAEALELLGRSREAMTVRLDSLGWARYGFGADWAVHAKLREVAALNPVNGPS
ncbi:DUF2927 domain-containing protein [Lutimaribacter sp. EGI FJ00015]|uniref:DUF2927 domain-containing protein n=1 Tax=Lutimaribacter degradans TaxID=2945989 RepID=A0ACC5ZVS0_9RHOB|nr:DUF2927 domain-containing protein [Lutimaribacter sp. EGI FJ00013]MCM2562406.1 DUF2927 domain-containing protein [Lutimaribacter sp. EGI FJ00013]MCO0613563.1 DUF2927 domain-containing protein [Lutimaribacter sp. EGI FJ00015]MCO0636535.1 DUF2927 domain-containing protein [Lutimaribacter sp. EGI FJ00014]